MRTIQAIDNEIEPSKFKFKLSSHDDFDEVIEPPVRVTDKDGRLILIAMPIDRTNEDIRTLRSALRSLKYQKSSRTNGLVTQSRVIGFLPRITIRRDFCTSTSAAHSQKHEHQTICDWSSWCSQQYEKFSPELFNAHKKKLEESVLKEWQIPDSVYTNGIVNKNNSLRYHFDAGNFKNTWSSMITMPMEVVGGELILPRLRLAIRYGLPAITMFDGQSELHGVHRIQRGERYTVVYYCLEGMKNCLPPDEEVKRIRSKKTERESKRTESNNGK